MKPFQFFYRFSRGQQKGIIALFAVIVIIQATYYILMFYSFEGVVQQSEKEKQWLALQSQINELKAQKDSAKFIIYPFNPNYISDYKGYTLGMSAQEIDRLHKFRKSGKFINSAADFQMVTKVSDSFLAKLSPYFKFPDWVNKEPSVAVGSPVRHNGEERNKFPPPAVKEKKITVIDINEALEEDLSRAYGIGPAFAKKILRKRAQLGGYVSMQQLEEFPEFSPEAIKDLKQYFAVIKQPQVNKLNINSASLSQLSNFPYFNKSIAKTIITRRSMKGKIDNAEELLNLNGFPVDKINIIALYLEF